MRVRLVASILAGIVLILLTAFTGDADAIDPGNVQENAAIPVSNLSDANSIGQTFVSHYDRLHSIQILAVTSDDLEYSNDSRITLHARQRPDAVSDLATVSIPMSAFAHNHWVKFNFSPLENSRNQSFYFFLDASQVHVSRGWFSVWSSDDDVYADGKLYINGTATNRDLVFRTYYGPDLFFLSGELIRLLVKYSSTIILVLLICFIVSLLLFLVSAQSVQFPSSNLQSLISNLHASCPTCLALVMLCVIAFSVNLLQIRDVPVPLWKDSPVHAEFISQILAMGQIPGGQFYHFGFHVLAAFLAKISGVSIPQMMLVLGQIFLTLTGLTTWLFVRRLTGNEIAALTSALCVWFFSPTPAYFVNWGRYPLILGGALLPLALYLVIELIEQPHWNPRIFLIAFATFLGMAFVHVRLAAFYLVFVALYLVDLIIRKRTQENRLPIILRAGVLVILGIAIISFWIVNTALQTGLSFIAMSSSTALLDTDVAFQVLSLHHGVMLIVLMCVGILISIWQRSRGALLSAFWFIALFTFSLLPSTWLGGELVSPAFVLLMAFLPMAIIIGEMMAWLYKKTTASSKQAVVVWCVAFSIVIFLGACDMIALVSPATIIFSDADQTAMEWISQNTPRDAKFLINSDEWFPSSFSPSDGGWWIPYVTGRPIDWLASFTDARTVSDQLAEKNIEWIYLGWRGGVLKKTDFICQPARYVLRYNQHGVAILQVRQSNEPIAPLPDCARP